VLVDEAKTESELDLVGAGPLEALPVWEERWPPRIREPERRSSKYRRALANCQDWPPFDDVSPV
jgi:hypothetical protein